MDSFTKKILFFSLLISSLTLGIFLLLVYQVKEVGTKLNTYIIALGEKNAREEAFIKVSRLIQESAEKRSILASAFFSDEGSSVTFLNDLETFASSINLNLKTDVLEKVTNEDKSESISMTFIYSGPKDKVLTFTKFLEEIPYHSSITAFDFKQTEPNTWEGKLTLLISLTPS